MQQRGQRRDSRRPRRGRAAISPRRFRQARHRNALENRNRFKPDEFPAERSCLLAWKLVVACAVPGAKDEDENTGRFRHDRVWDFFIAAAFARDPGLWAAHAIGPRFRGVYLRIKRLERRPRTQFVF